MALPALVQTVVGDDGVQPITPTATITPAAGNVLVAVCYYADFTNIPDPLSISDDRANVWSTACANIGGSSYQAAMFYCLNLTPAVATVVSPSYPTPATGAEGMVRVMEFSGVLKQTVYASSISFQGQPSPMYMTPSLIADRQLLLVGSLHAVPNQLGGIEAASGYSTAGSVYQPGAALAMVQGYKVVNAVGTQQMFCPAPAGVTGYPIMQAAFLCESPATTPALEVGSLGGRGGGR